jgi:hypothetical protein
MTPDLNQIGKMLIIGGIIIVLAGVLFLFGDKIPFIGKLPGDIFIKRKNFTFYFPIISSMLLSLIISLILYFIRRK